MKILLSYLRDRGRVFVLLTAFLAIFTVICWVSKVPVASALYAALLCLVLWAVVGAVGLWRYARKHRQLEQLASFDAQGMEHLPDPQGLIERDYTALLRVLREENLHLASAAEGERTELCEYYTLWAHQIKTPIAAMRLLLDDEGVPDAAALRGELFRIERYVGMALGYARLEGSDLVLAEYSIEKLARAAVRSHAPMFIAKHLTAEVDVPETMTALTDVKWLGFVLEQLISNAVKYTPQGGVRIYASGDELIVEDTGIGIRPEDVPRVCEKGFTGYNGRSDRKSTGIGLYLCRRTCDMLGHAMRIESEPGVGTKVILSLGREPVEANR